MIKINRITMSLENEEIFVKNKQELYEFRNEIARDLGMNTSNILFSYEDQTDNNNQDGSKQN